MTDYTKEVNEMAEAIWKSLDSKHYDETIPVQDLYEIIKHLAPYAAALRERDAAIVALKDIAETRFLDGGMLTGDECRKLARDFLARRDAVVWLIERGQAQGQSPSVWWTGDAWTLEAIRAKRFSSKVECEQYATGNALLTGIDSVHPRTWQATEHIFVAEARDFLSKQEGK